MNTQRIIVLGLALVAAAGAALLVRGMMGGGTPNVQAKISEPAIAMSDVLVASQNLQPGQGLDMGKVRFQSWPTKSVDASFVTRDAVSNLSDAIKDMVVRAPVIAGQPITTTAVVHGKTAGFMAAMLQPGMRAVSITISVDSGAGGFILPNDRVDIILTLKTGDVAHSRTLLSSIRVLAIDQTFKEDKDTKTVIGKNATLELTPAQALTVARAQNTGILSLSLRPLEDTDAAMAANDTAARANHGRAAAEEDSGDDTSGASVAIIRYGVVGKSNAASAQEGRPQ